MMWHINTQHDERGEGGGGRVGQRVHEENMNSSKVASVEKIERKQFWYDNPIACEELRTFVQSETIEWLRLEIT